MKTVWLVGVANCEENRIACICATKELAEKYLFIERDKLTKDWQEMDAWCKQHDIEYNKEHPNAQVSEDKGYQIMIQNLSGNDYENWNNYPHDVPYIQAREVIGE